MRSKVAAEYNGLYAESSDDGYLAFLEQETLKIAPSFRFDDDFSAHSYTIQLKMPLKSKEFRAL
jgi:hypothetical protein